MHYFQGENLRKEDSPSRVAPFLFTSVTQERNLVFSDWRIGRLLVTEMK
jgi:hypothetical protein